MLAVQTNQIRQEIQKMKGLPPLPVIAQQLLGVINDDTASIEEISGIIQRDPSLMSRLLGLANSAFFSFGRKIFTLDEAVIYVLGLDLVKSISLSMVVGGSFDVKKCKHFDVTRYWASALMTAELAKRVSTIALAVEGDKPNQMYLLGLLHNLGILILVDRYPDLMDEIFKVASKDPERRLIHTQQAMLDIDHHQAGSWLAHKWHLPDEVIQVIENHQHLNYRGDYSSEVLLIGLCSRIVRNWLLGKEMLLPDNEDLLLERLAVDKSKLAEVAEKCHLKLDEIEGVANEMAN